jgi:hypothetical protein
MELPDFDMTLSKQAFMLNERDVQSRYRSKSTSSKAPLFETFPQGIQASTLAFLQGFQSVRALFMNAFPALESNLTT